MRGYLVILLLTAGLVFTSVALAASSPPVGGGHYQGRDNAKAPFKINRSVTFTVTGNRQQFAYGRMNFLLRGQGGLGSCAGESYVTLSPSPQREISRAGSFNLHGRFSFTVPTPYGGLVYHAAARVKGAFSDRGRKLTGTVTETASRRGFSCHSGTVRFSAKLTR